MTVPHKEAAFALSARADPAAEIAGAANLLVFSQDGIQASNTDAAGIVAAISAVLGPEALRGKKTAIWGAGGAARGAILALCELGVAQISAYSTAIPPVPVPWSRRYPRT